MKTFFKFIAHEGGNVALMFGLLMVPVLVGAGVGFDLVRANQMRASLIDATDAAVLAAARAKVLDNTLTNAEAKAIAERYIAANRIVSSDLLINNISFIYNPGTETYKVTVQAASTTTLLGIVGRDQINLNITSEARVGAPRALEAVLVLDNTESMDGQKIIDLRDAATTLVNAIMADTDNEVLVGLVPFGQHVNVGVSRRFEPWISVPPDGTWDYEDCDVDEIAAAALSCTEDPYVCDDDGVPYACTRWECPAGVDRPYICTTTTRNSSWQGCAGSRTHPLNITDDQFLVSPVPGILGDTDWGAECPNEILPMTTNKADVLADITAMATTGDTYIPGGLTWGLRLISAASPFTEGRTYADIQAEAGTKAIVLMTDGMNTLSPDAWGQHYEDDEALADQYTLELCDEIKSNDIVLYTIAFDITDPDTLTLIQGCATNADAFFDASNAAELSAAFGSIGNSLTELALTK